MGGILLTDTEIVAAIINNEIVVTGLDPNFGALKSNGPVQPCSLDLTIGHIFAPPPDGSSTAELAFVTGFQLEPGHTAVVETRERIKLAGTIGAFGFPPSSVSRNAILMTNPGHIDPGYSGHLTFTLINMGRETYSLRHSDLLVTLLLFRFDAPVGADYSSRGSSTPSDVKFAELLNRLAPDFAGYSQRMAAEVENAVQDKLYVFDQRTKDAEKSFDKARLYIPAFTGFAGAVIVAAAAFGVPFFHFASNDDVKNLESRVTAMEQQADIASVKARLKALEDQNAKP